MRYPGIGGGNTPNVLMATHQAQQQRRSQDLERQRIAHDLALGLGGLALGGAKLGVQAGIEIPEQARRQEEGHKFRLKEIEEQAKARAKYVPSLNINNLLTGIDRENAVKAFENLGPAAATGAWSVGDVRRAAVDPAFRTGMEESIRLSDVEGLPERLGLQKDPASDEYPLVGPEEMQRIVEDPQTAVALWRHIIGSGPQSTPLMRKPDTVRAAALLAERGGATNLFPASPAPTNKPIPDFRQAGWEMSEIAPTDAEVLREMLQQLLNRAGALKDVHGDEALQQYIREYGQWPPK